MVAEIRSFAQECDDCTLAKVSAVLDWIADGNGCVPPDLLTDARLACQAVHRLSLRADRVVVKAAAGELTQDEARRLNGDAAYDAEQIPPTLRTGQDVDPT